MALMDFSTLSVKRFQYVTTWLCLSYGISIVSIVADVVLNGLNSGFVIGQISIMCMVALAGAIRVINRTIDPNANDFYITLSIITIIILTVSSIVGPTYLKTNVEHGAAPIIIPSIICALSCVLFVKLLLMSKEYPTEEEKVKASMAEINKVSEEARDAFANIIGGQNV